MDSLVIILIAVLIILNLGVIFFLVKKKTEVIENKTEQVLKDEIKVEISLVYRLQ